MTSRLMYEAVLIELRKENAPNILLEDFNYFVNKAINQYINKRYNIYDINQQTTDDLRVLKATALLEPRKVSDYKDLSLATDATYEILLPSDYLHMLNCICVYDVNKTYKCYNQGDTWRAAATRLTADAYSQVLDNFWNKPTYKRPYYYIHNVNLSEFNPTNPYNGGDYLDKWGTTDISVDIIDNINEAEIKQFVERYTPTLSDGLYLTHDSEGIPVFMEVERNDDPEASLYGYLEELPNPSVYYKTTGNKLFAISGNKWKLLNGTDKDRSGNIIISNSNRDMFSSIDIEGIEKTSNVLRGSQIRYGNASQVRCEIRYGTDDSIFKLKKVYIDYIKAPQNIRLTQFELDNTEDYSLLLEFPDYVCQEIINELVHVIMENISDMRLQTHPVVSLSIANPAQQLTEPVALQQPT